MTDYEGKIKSQSYAEKFEDVIEEIRCFNSMYTSQKAEELLKCMIRAKHLFILMGCEFITIISKRNELENDISTPILKFVGKGRDVEEFKEGKRCM